MELGENIRLWGTFGEQPESEVKIIVSTKLISTQLAKIVSLLFVIEVLEVRILLWSTQLEAKVLVNSIQKHVNSDFVSR